MAKQNRRIKLATAKIKQAQKRIKKEKRYREIDRIINKTVEKFIGIPDILSMGGFSFLNSRFFM